MTRLTGGQVVPELTEEEANEEQDMPDYAHWHLNKTKFINQGENKVRSLGGVKRKPQSSKA